LRQPNLYRQRDADTVNPMNWTLSHRADVDALPLADRHYNRQKIGSPQFVPPGRCVVLKQDAALWVTSWPFPEYVKHAWPGAWINSMFRNESTGIASDMIREAIAATRAEWSDIPDLGMVTFIDPKKVRARMVHGRQTWGHCYFAAGFVHVGYTKDGLWAMQLTPDRMPAPVKAFVSAPLFDEPPHPAAAFASTDGVSSTAGRIGA